MPTPKIDAKKCKKCFTCVSVCPVSVFTKVSDKEPPKVAKPGDCLGCQSCVVNCPEQAITLTEEKRKK